jgi:hypothetical protein
MEITQQIREAAEREGRSAAGVVDAGLAEKAAEFRRTHDA